MVVLIGADIEDFARHARVGRLGRDQESLGDIFHVDVRPPRLASADGDSRCRHGAVGHRVDHQVESHARRGAEHGAESERDDGPVRKLACEDLLGDDPAARVERNGIQLRALVQDQPLGGAVNGARRREHHALDRRSESNDVAQQLGRLDVDRDGLVVIELARRIANERRQRDDGLDAFRGSDHVADVADVARDDFEARVGAAAREPGVAVEEGLEDAHAVALLEHHAHEVGADVAGAARDENRVARANHIVIHILPPCGTAEP